MAKQIQLTAEQTEQAERAKQSVARLGAWDDMEGGDSYWREVWTRLHYMAKNGTSDGKPYVEPPLTDADACQRIPVMCWDDCMDKACGPFVLIRVRIDIIRTNSRIPYVVESSDGITKFFCNARRLTPAEQAAWEAAK